MIIRNWKIDEKKKSTNSKNSNLHLKISKWIDISKILLDKFVKEIEISTLKIKLNRNMKNIMILFG
jgi:hypothetical protein